MKDKIIELLASRAKDLTEEIDSDVRSLELLKTRIIASRGSLEEIRSWYAQIQDGILDPPAPRADELELTEEVEDEG